MRRTYKTLVDLSVGHNFYTDNRSNDFIFLPTDKTAKDLSRYKCLARTKNKIVGQPESYGLTVSYVEQNSNPLIEITASNNPSLVFGMQLHNSRFYNYTDEVSLLNGGEIFYYTNVGANTVPATVSLIRSKMGLKRKVFPYRYDHGGGYPKTVGLKILDEAGVNIAGYEQTKTIDEGDFEFLVDLNGLPDGRYSVQILDGGLGGAELEKTTYYVSDQLTMAGVFGIIDLRLVNNTDFSAKTLEIDFTQRETKWKYFVVYYTPLEVTDTIVLQKAPGSFNFTEVTSFAGAARAEDKATKESLESRFPTADVRLYESDNPISYQEVITKGIKLKKNTTDLINHMPGPSLDSPKAEAYIFI